MCEYCENGKRLQVGNWNETMTIEKEPDGTYHIDCYGSISGEIFYCPMCSRKLNEEK